MFGNRALGTQRPPTLTQFLDQNADSVSADVGAGQSRSSRRSPSAASPHRRCSARRKGMSVFQDGVRVNESFGDVVNWDLLPPLGDLVDPAHPRIDAGVRPQHARRRARDLHEERRTVSGCERRDLRRLVRPLRGAGRSRRRAATSSTGTPPAAISNDQGWAEHNPSRLEQFFGKVGYQDGITDLRHQHDARRQHARRLADAAAVDARQPTAGIHVPRQQPQPARVRRGEGQPLPRRNAAARRQRLLSPVQEHERQQQRQRRLRRSRRRSAVDERGVQRSLDDRPAKLGRRAAAHQEREGGRDVAPARRAASRATSATRASRRNRRPRTSHPIARRSRRDRSSSRPTPTFATTITARYVSDTIALDPQWTLTLAGRYNYARITDRRPLRQRSRARRHEHTYARFSPAIGVNYKPCRRAHARTPSYNEGMRAPTPIELTCADPDGAVQAPEPVPRRSAASEGRVEDVRGQARAATSAPRRRGQPPLYRTRALRRHPVHRERRRATNAGLLPERRPDAAPGLRARGLRARRRLVVSTSATAASTQRTARRSSRSARTTRAPTRTGAIVVQPGDRIPGIPRDSVKLRVEFEPVERFAIGVNMLVCVIAVRARRREQPGPQWTACRPIRVFNLDARYDVDARPAAWSSTSPTCSTVPIRPSALARRELLHRARTTRSAPRKASRRWPSSSVRPAAPRGICGRRALCVRPSVGCQPIAGRHPR